MEPHVSLITLGVPDVEQSRQFYVDGLGWEPILDVPGQVVFLQIGHGVALSIFGAAELAKDIDPALATDRAAVSVQGPLGFALAHNVGSPAEVDAVLADAARAGATILKSAQHAEWGGYHGYFADPAGTVWEVAHNPGWSVADDGTVQMGIVD